MPDLPPSLKRKGARSDHEREQQLLERHRLMRDVRKAILWPHSGDPDLDTWIMAAEEMGFTVALAGEVATFAHGEGDDKSVVFQAWDTPVGAQVWVWAT